MRHLKEILVIGMAMVLVAAVATSAYAADPDLVPGNPVYITLGDSWAHGQGATDPAATGYAALLAGSLIDDLDCLPAPSDKAQDGCRQLQHLNLARSATDTLPGVTAQHVASEQLPVAIPIIEARNGDANPANNVEAITIHVGGNDVSGPIQTQCLGGFTAACVGTWLGEMAAFEADLRDVVGPLREAAGDGAPIVLGTYDNPVATCFLGDVFGADAVFLGAMVLEGSPEGFPLALDGIHDVVRRVADDYNADVAESFDSLAPSDFVGGQDCLHITDSGHQKVAATFAAILES